MNGERAIVLETRIKRQVIDHGSPGQISLRVRSTLGRKCLHTIDSTRLADFRRVAIAAQVCKNGATQTQEYIYLSRPISRGYVRPHNLLFGVACEQSRRLVP